MPVRGVQRVDGHGRWLPVLQHRHEFLRRAAGRHHERDDLADTRAGAQVIKAKVPLSEMFGYVTQLRSLSSGRASSTMEFSHYAPAPRNIEEEVVAKSKGKVSA